jgi:hypothetical protein
MPRQVTNKDVFRELASGVHPVDAQLVSKALKATAHVSPHDTGVYVRYKNMDVTLPAFAENFSGNNYPRLKEIAATILAAEYP